MTSGISNGMSLHSVSSVSRTHLGAFHVSFITLTGDEDVKQEYKVALEDILRNGI